MAKASDNAFPSLLLVEQASAPAAPAAGQARLYRGTDNNLYMVDEAGVASQVGGGVSGGTKVLSGFKQRTAGNVGISALFTTAYAAVDTTLDITLAAAVGDIVEVGLSSFWLNENVAGMLDVASIVSGAAVNWWSGGTGNREGVNAWQGPGTLYMPIGGSVMKTIVAGDLSSGNVTLRLMGATPGGTKTLVAAATKPLQFWAKNLGH